MIKMWYKQKEKKAVGNKKNVKAGNLLVKVQRKYKQQRYLLKNGRTYYITAYQ